MYFTVVFVIVRLNNLFQKMSEWVAVCADEAEEPVEIPTEADGDPFGLIEHVKSGLGGCKTAAACQHSLEISSQDRCC